MSKNVDGKVTKYCYNGGQVIAEYDSNGALLRKFIYGPGSNAVYYCHFDGLGSVVALSDANSDIVERYSYDVFGQPDGTCQEKEPAKNEGIFRMGNSADILNTKKFDIF